MNIDSAVFYTNDLDKAINFYQKLIGLDIEYRQSDNYVSFIFPNKVRLGIKRATEERENPGAQTIIISIEEIDSFYQEIKKKEVTIYTELKDESWGRTFSILDADNNRIEFLKRN
jgi:predicted enzyme related to lactoylglutathione lyase